MATGWVTSHHPTRAELTACVQCGLCLPACPTFRLTGDESASPRGRLTAMSAVAAGIAPVDGAFAEMMGFCLQCRACEAVCPSLVPFGRAMEGARAEVTAQRPSWGRRLRHVLLGRKVLGNRVVVRLATAAVAAAQRLGVAPRLPGGGSLAGLRTLRVWPETMIGGEWPAEGEEIGTAALLAGCVMEPWFPEVHAAVVQVLRRAGYRVVVPAGQTCCGALAAHDGAAARAEEMARINGKAFAGADVVVADAAGCGAQLRDYRHWLPAGAAFPPVADVTELVAAAIVDGRLPAFPSTGRRVAMQDPCHLRHAQRVVDEPRAVLRAAGWDPVEIDPDGLCCGAAGIYSVLRPAASAELGGRKAAQIRATGTVVVASANPGCEIQLRGHLGRSYRIAHPVELYDEALRGPG